MHSQSSYTPDGLGGEEFLRKRVAWFAVLAFGIGAGFYLLRALSMLAARPNAIGEMINHGSMHYHLAGFLPYVVLWLLTRTGPRPTVFVQVAEGATLVVSSFAYQQMGDYIPLIAGGPLIVILAMAMAFIMRAVLVPSRARTTALLGLIIGVPLAWSMYQRLLVDQQYYEVMTTTLSELATGETPPIDQFAKGNTIGLTAWWVSAAAVGTLASHVIYGLRQAADEAAQLGQYTLVSKIGEGGMGAVYRARHALLRRPTAIKLLLPERAGDTTLARFEREVQRTAELSHPNTVTVFDYGRTPDGIFYYAMELLDGATLEAIVGADGPQSAARIVHVLRQVAGALTEAHQRGLIHRDIKPANIILCERGGTPDVAKVVDFGLVKSIDAGGEETNVTIANVVTGTPLYMAPEAITNPENVDARADIYSLGAVMYNLLTGTHVFDGDSVVEVCGHHLHTTPEPPSKRADRDVDPELERLTLDCLAKAPKDRPQDGRAFLDRLQSIALAATWTEEDARVWWAKHETIAQKRGSDEPVSRTIAIDLRRARSR